MAWPLKISALAAREPKREIGDDVNTVGKHTRETC